MLPTKLTQKSGDHVYPKHYQEGEEIPPNIPGKLRIYSTQFCPYAQRTRLILEKHNVEYEVVNINLAKKPKWFFTKYDQATVPVLEFDGKLIPESLEASRFVDEFYSRNHSLQASDPFERARHDILLDIHSRVIRWFYAHVLKNQEGAKEAFYKALPTFENAIVVRGPFIAGAWMEELPADRFPALVQWISDMKKDEAVSRLLTPRKILAAFLVEYVNKSGIYEYDLSKEVTTPCGFQPSD